MLCFALWSLRSRWSRIVTLCLGLICVSICTTLLAGLAQLSTLSADQQLSRAWQSAPYDLLVRAPAALSPVERQLQVVDPSGPEQIYGGISLEQVNTIAHIPHVAVAAPEAVIGWVMLRPYVLITFNRPGFYRVTTELVVPGKESTQDRLQNLYEVLPLSVYREVAGQESAKLTYVPLDTSGTATIAAFWPLPTLLVGIDPGAEARLAGLQWQPATMKSNGTVGMPLLMDTHPWASLTASISAEYASLPGPLLKGKDGGDNLVVANLATDVNIPSASWTQFVGQQFDSKSLLHVLAQELNGQQQIPCLGACEGENGVASTSTIMNVDKLGWPSQGADQSAVGAINRPLRGFTARVGAGSGIPVVVPLQGGGLTRYARLGYAIVTQPDNANNAPPVLSVFSMGADAGGLLTRLPLLPEATTPWITFGGSGGSFATFDGMNLPISRNSTSSWVASGLYEPQPGTAPLSLSPQHSIISLPPLLFTTINAACRLTGGECISAVRVRVAGVDAFSQYSEALLQQVAADIERRTGLHVDVLRGASGRQMEVQVAADSASPTVFSEVWIQPHAAVAVANGVSGANVLLLLSEVGVAALALIAAALLSTGSRQDELAILLRIGWSGGRILIESMIESAIIALLAGLPAWGLVVLLSLLRMPSVAPITILYALGAAILLYIIICTLAARAVLVKLVTYGAGRGYRGGATPGRDKSGPYAPGPSLRSACFAHPFQKGSGREDATPPRGGASTPSPQPPNPRPYWSQRGSGGGPTPPKGELKAARTQQFNGANGTTPPQGDHKGPRPSSASTPAPTGGTAFSNLDAVMQGPATSPRPPRGDHKGPLPSSASTPAPTMTMRAKESPHQGDHKGPLPSSASTPAPTMTTVAYQVAPCLSKGRGSGGGRDEIPNTPWWLLMFYRQVSSRMGSIVLVVLSIMGACGLVSLMLLVYWGLDGLLYTTLLGQEVQITLSGIHLVTAALTCISAALTAGLIIMLMVRERKREFAMLLAIGWRGRTVAQEVVREGMVLGFLGGLSGGTIAVLVFLGVYHIWSPLLFVGCMAGAAVLGMILCVLGALYPAVLAGRLAPRQIFAQA